MSFYLTTSLVKSVVNGTTNSKHIRNIDDKEMIKYLNNFDEDLVKYAFKNYILNLNEVQLYMFMKDKWTMETIVKKPSVVKLFKVLMDIADESIVLKCMERTEKMKDNEISVEAKNKKTAQRFIYQLSNRDR